MIIGPRNIALAALAWCASLAPLAAAEPVAKPANQADDNPADVAGWIAQLDSDDYGKREQATRRLAEAGASAIPGLIEAATGASLEVTVRAVDILRELASVDDVVTEDAAFAGLNQLARGTHRPAAGRATATIERLSGTRHERAIARLKERGATVNAPSDNEQAAMFPGGIVVRGGVVIVDAFEDGEVRSQARTTVQIGPEWTAGRKGLALLGRLNGVAHLTLVGPQVTDEWMEDIGALDRLKPTGLTLRRTKVTDAGLKSLARLGSLNQLSIFHTPGITDEGASRLSALGNLQFVQLYGTKVSDTGAAALAKALPNARIDRRHGALLGVRCEVGDEDVCMVTGVQPESAAEKAGILAEDVIVGFGGKPVKGFASLTALISDKAGGEKVDVELMRGDKKITTTVTLGQW